MKPSRILSLSGIVLLLGLLGLLIFAIAPTSSRALENTPESNTKALVSDGRYIATAADCIACHTAPDGKPFAGGLALASPIGNIYSTNITPDPTTGIGKYSLNDFDRAVRYGIAPDGTSLYPAMPYPSYARMSDQDLRALYAYFREEVAPVEAKNRASDIHWPLSMRWPLAIWRKLYAPPVVPIDSTHYADVKIARGAYLVQSLGHCGSCHTPRAITLQEISLDDTQLSYLSGGPIIDGWVAVNLRGNDGAGLGRSSVQEIVDILRSARNLNSAVVGKPMSDVVKHSMQNLSDTDLESIAVYLKTLSPSANDTSHFKPNSETAIALKAGQESGRGAQLYLDNCAACHRSNGEGGPKVFPAIAGNPTVLAANPGTLIKLVLDGSALPATKTAPSNLGMPGFAWRLSDDEVAQLVNFVRQSWGNSAALTSAEDVAKVRKSEGG